MVKKIILLSLFLAAIGLRAQSYYPITDGCTWSVSEEKYMTAGDTVLNGKTYYKIYKQIDNQPFEFDLSQAEFFAAIRNNSAERKVYAYLPEGTWIRDFVGYSSFQIDTAMEVLIYDFSLEIGDTVNCYILGDYVTRSVAVRTETANMDIGWDGYSPVVHQYGVVDTMVTLSDNSSRKQIFLRDLYANLYHVWIEGIGSIRGFDEGMQMFWSDYGYRILLCFTDSLGTQFQTEYDLDNDPNDCFSNGYGGDVQESEFLDIKIYPNPVTDKLHISLSQMENREMYLQIINTMGLCVYREKLVGLDYEKNINISLLPKGIYMLVIKQSKNHFTHKIIKL